MSKLSKNIMAKLDEFTTRQGIISAEWCKLLGTTEKHFQSLELELARTKKMLDEAKEVIGFYANGGHYYKGGLSHGDFNNWQINHEADSGNIIAPGKRARSFLAKHEKKGNV